MKRYKFIWFYIICCTSNLALTYFLDSNNIDFLFGYQLYVMYIVFFFAPISTIIIYLFYRWGINKEIVNKMYWSMLYSLYPELAYRLLVFCHNHDILTCISASDEFYLVIVCVVNVGILLRGILRCNIFNCRGRRW